MKQLKFIGNLLAILALTITVSSAQLTDNPNANGVIGQPDFVTKVSGTTANSLNGPNGVAVDPTTGKLFIVDRSNHRVLRFSSAAALEVGADAEAVFGQTDFVTKTTGTAADKMNNPIGISIDKNGTMYIGDFSNNRVLRFDNASSKTTGASADGVLGQADFVTGTGVTSASGMRGPVGVHIDGNGTLWVNEFSAHRITRFDNAASKANGADADGVLGQPDFVTSTSGLTAATMSSPNGVYADANGTVWVSDNGNKRVLRFDNAAGKANGADADGVLGQPDFVTNTNNITRNGFTALRFVWGDSQGRIYVIQENSHRMVIFNDAANKANGADADYIWGQADYVTGTAANPPTASSYNTPRALYIDEVNNHLWMADYANHRVLRYDVNYNTDPTVMLGTPTKGEILSIGSVYNISWNAQNISFVNVKYSTDNGVNWTGIQSNVDASLGNINWMVPNEPSIAVKVRVEDASNAEVFSETDDLSILHSAPFVITDNPEANAVIGQPDFVTKVSGLAANALNGPNGVAVDPVSGKLFVVDRGNHRVLRWGSAEALQAGADAEAVFGQTDFVTKTTGTAADKMNNPIGISIDKNGTMYIGDFSNNRVLRFDNASSKETGASADGVLGQADFVTGTGVTSASGMKGPVGVHIDGNGTLWVNEFSNHRITRFDNAASKANGADADGVLGQPDFVTGTSGLTAATMASPNGVYADANGTVWVSDSGNRRVLRFDNAANKANGADADGVLGQPDFITNTSNVTRNGFTSLRFVWGDSQGRLFVIQEGSHRMVIFNDAANKANGADADYIWGQADYVTGTAANPPTASSYNTPRALYIDEVRSTLWLADYSNHRVLRYDLPRENVQMVKVNAPNGGETYSIGKIYPISWSSNSVENVKLEYSSNNGSDWNEITVVPSVNGSFAWTVPDAASEQALVRVSNVADANVSDVSDAVFTIAPPVEVVTVVSPNGFQHWGKASKKNILFTTQDVASVDLYFSDNNGQSWNSIATSVSAASGSYLWELPNATSNQMLVKVTKAGDMNVDDVSDATFAIVEPMEGHEQDYIFFADSPTPNFYDPSWNSVTAPSTLLRVGEKMPVSAEYSFTGTYSIKLNWKSMTGGNWAAAIAGVGWPGRDLTSKDTLEFRVFTTTALAIADMPFIYLEDLSNQKSTKLPLGTLTNSFEANTWNLVKIPTSTFVENKGGADLTRVKTVFFGQNAADEVEHTLFIDDMRASGGEIITGEDRNLIVVIGSSTSAGIGASTSDSSYVGRLRKWVLDRDPNAYVINLAVGGYTSYDLMASDFVPPSGRPAPKVNNNITYALTYKPDAIIMNLPSNDANIGMTIEEQVSNFDAIVAQAGDIPMWITTTQPRNFTETAKRESLMQMRDSILTKYGDRAIEIFTELAEADGTIKAKYNSGDGIHLNDSGHKYIFEQVVATGFWGVVTPIENGTEVIKEFQLFQNYPNPFNPTTQIRFNLANSTQNVVLTVYDILGRKVATLINGSMGAGAHTVNFDASRYASGTYIYRLQAGENVSVKKMTLVK